MEAALTEGFLVRVASISDVTYCSTFVNVAGVYLDFLTRAMVTTLSDTARTYSDYSGPRGGVAA